MPSNPGSLPAEERLLSLDIVRGAALAGIFVMNVPGFSHSLFTSPEIAELQGSALDHAADALREWLFAGKFNSIFSLLFGIGFALQLGRLEAAEPGRAERIYLRRLAALFAVGLVHAALVWAGDVLLLYAVMGMVLLALRRAPDGVLIALALLGLLYPALASLLRPHWLSVADEALAAFQYQDLEASNNLAFGSGSFVDAARETLRVFAWGWGTPLGRWSYSLFYAHMATAMLIGCLIGRRGWLLRLPTWRAQPWRWPAIALTLAVIGELASAWLGRDGAQGEATWAVALAQAADGSARLALAAFYILVLLRLAQQARWLPLLMPLAAAGRMPLTNYLLQTALGTFIFYGWGLGYWGRAGSAVELALAPLLFFAIQVPLSVAWLRRWRYGPLEYLWRAWTYRRWPAARARA